MVSFPSHLLQSDLTLIYHLQLKKELPDPPALLLLLLRLLQPPLLPLVDRRSLGAVLLHVVESTILEVVQPSPHPRTPILTRTVPLKNRLRQKVKEDVSWPFWR